MAELDYRLLGSVEVRDGSRPLAVGGGKQRAVLALLLLEANRVVSTDRLIEDLWPQRPPGKPHTAVQGYVSDLRKLLEPEHASGAPFQVLVTEGSGYAIRLDADQLDVLRFERLLAEGRGDLVDGRSDAAATRLREALSLWRGPAVAEFTYEAWAQGAIARLEELRLACLEERIEADLALGRHAELVGELEALVNEHPLRERMRGQLMLALYRAGRQAEALEAYQDARRALVDELGIDPTPHLQVLEKKILRQDASLAEPVHERTSVHRPAVRAVRAVRATSMPRPPTPLIGRKRELAELQALLTRPDVRLLTLTGPGGSGKTRLALALAEQALPNFRDGAVFVELASIRDPALVVATVGQALGLREGGDEPFSDLLQSFLRERALLLCLDNFEQLLEAGPSLAELLEAPELKLLVTSRERLHLQAEHEYSLEPLSVPAVEADLDLDALSQVEAISLFLARAQAVQPQFRLSDDNAPSIAEICRRLDGLPLALELAAARLKLLSPDAMLRWLERGLEVLTGGAHDLPLRQQTLRATIDWSYGLLDEEERQLLWRLGVFADSCTLEAAEAICRAQLHSLSSLVDKSLLRQRAGVGGQQRFAMLETVRQYARERLAESGEADELASVHAGYFLDLSEQAEGELVGPAAPEWLSRLEQELAELRAALDFSVAHGDIEAALRILSALPRFWKARGHATEARRRLAEALKGPSDTSMRAKALWAAGYLAGVQGDRASAATSLKESIEIYRALKDVQGLVLPLAHLAYCVQIDEERARQLAEESVAIARALGRDWLLCEPLHALAEGGGRDDERGGRLLEECLSVARAAGYKQEIGFALNDLAVLSARHGEFEQATTFLNEALLLAEELEDVDLHGYVMGNLGWAALNLGAERRAGEAFAEELAVASASGDRELVEEALRGLAAVAAAEDRDERAAWLYGAAFAQSEALHMDPLAIEPPTTGLNSTALRERDTKRLKERLGESRFAAAWADGRALTREQAIAYALEAARTESTDTPAPARSLGLAGA